MLQNLNNLLLEKSKVSHNLVSEYLNNNPIKDAYMLSLNDYRTLITDHLSKLAVTGIFKAPFPTSVGGGGDIVSGITALQTLAFGDISLMVKAGVQWGLFGGSVANLGGELQQKEYLPKIISGDICGCFAMTETGHGSDVFSIETTASYDRIREEFIIRTPTVSASKNYIGSAAIDADMAVVFAQLFTGDSDRGVHAFLVPIRDSNKKLLPGINIEDCGIKIGLNGVDNGSIVFNNIRIPRTALLNRFAEVNSDGTYTSSIANNKERFFKMLGALVQGRITIAGAAINSSKKALHISIKYALSRKQFFDNHNNEIRLLDYNIHRRRLLLPLAKTYALHFAQDKLLAYFSKSSENFNTRDLETYAAGLKAVSSWHTTQTIQTCREACGGAAYLLKNQLGEIKNDTEIFTTFEGDNTVLLELVGKNILDKMVKDLSNLDIAKFFADQVGDTMSEKSLLRQLFTRFTDGKRTKLDERGIIDRSWHLNLFADRHKHIANNLLKRFRANKTKDSFENFNNFTPHFLQLAKSYMDNFILDAFLESIFNVKDAELAMLLNDICDLYVLENLERNSSWFLEHDRISPAQSKAISSNIDILCEKLSVYAEVLVDAFDIPVSCISADFLKH